MAKLTGDVSEVNKNLKQNLYQSKQGWGHPTKESSL